ncbi:MAG: glycoside hydrolase family 88 protein, partial [Tannerellaceae bacterium]|nr:glycoside hydrolase family 88 protein [Tannerellaceae bacterium]
YHWDWAQATLLRAVADRWELGIDKENMLSYIRQSMDVTMDQAVGIHPNAVASAFGMALMARATGEDKYRQKAFEIYEQYLQIVRAGNGGVSHRDNVTELWDDTVYMVSLFLNEMYLLTGEEKYLRETAFQLMAHQEKLEDPKTGLWYHGWDGDSIDFDDGCCMLGWADNPERRGGQFWGRGNGWVAMTLANTLHLMPQKMEERDQLLALFHKMMQTLIPLQDEKTGHWYQLPLFPGEENNFIESSSTAMFGYAMALGIADGLLPEETYRPVVEKAYKGIETYSLEPLGNFLNITNVCSGTCIGDKAYYYGREVVAGTPFALGAAIMFHDRYF